MSLHVWDNEELQSSMKIVTDNEVYFYEYTQSKLDKNADILLSYIDKATFVSTSIFNDRFGNGMYWSNLSTGGKIILNIFYNPHICFDCTEAGDNVHASINSFIKEGNVINCMPYVLGEDYTNIDIMVGKDEDGVFSNIIEYNNNYGIILLRGCYTNGRS